MNKIRETVGMDRYGITNTTKLTDGTTVSDLLKQGKDLIYNSGVSFTELQKSCRRYCISVWQLLCAKLQTDTGIYEWADRWDRCGFRWKSGD